MKEGLFHSYTIVSVFEMCKNNICEVEVGDSESNNTWGFYIFFNFDIKELNASNNKE